MSVILSYLIKGSNQDVLDLRTPGREYELVGQSIVVTGSTASNIVYTAPGVELDARGLGGGEDVIVFTHAWSDYVKDTGAVAGGIVFTYVDSVAGLTERVIVGNGVASLTRDLLVFTDGSVLTQNVNTALRANPNVAISTVTGYNASLTAENIVVPTNGGSTTAVSASTTGPGAIFAMSTPGQVTQFTGTGSVDKVYVKAGSVVDARGLLGGEDIIYFTGNWTDYTKSTTAVSGGIQFTRSIGGHTEIVTVGNGVSAQSRDKLVFADGAVLTQNINNALRTDPGVAISAITGYDSVTTTPFLSDVSSVTFSGGQSSGLTNGTANAGDTVDQDGIAVVSNGLVVPVGSIEDQAGNAPGLTFTGDADNPSYRVDTVPPQVTALAVTAQTGAQNDTLNVGDTITVSVTFDQAVTVNGGTPTLKLLIGSTERLASYVAGSGSNALQFRYTIAAGDNNGDGLSDILVGARYNDFSGTNAGRAYVVYGKSGTATVQLTDIARNTGGFAITGEGSNDNFSFDVSNAGDVNGDGLDDLLVGAWNNPATKAGRAYLIFGRTDGAMGGTSVDVLGDASANALGDSGTAMTIVAGAGDDVVTLSAAGSIAYAGAGNDTIHINGAMISALSAKYGAGGNVGQLATIGGGSGIDTLTLDGAGLTLDLTQVSNASASLPNGSSRITSVERVDLTGTGNNTLKLSLNDVLDMSEANLFATTGRHQLMVTGDAGDTVQLAGVSSWAKSGTVDYAGGTYDAWNHNNALGTVYVLQTLTVLPV
ncbi:integrin alpha [Aureimonas altamirensis]|uniref:beta strand repeat-containing protein n=1 Tax=Aureimonas altamirensis TaxID=370622 RepID=UPI001E315449|nr:integrin alpha [Aureimonas altamirensis]UHD45003.1 integrin alpha [Aureimonas altamirensis]